MEDAQISIFTLSQEECKDVLAKNRIGRLACARDNRPYVVPIHYAYSDGCLYAFSLPGRKIDWMRANPRACVLVEEAGKGRQWRTVLAEGRYEELPDRIGHKRQRDHAWSLLSKHADWWEPGGRKPVNPPLTAYQPELFFRIVIETMSGRRATP
ncbi:pyridoxamine 5'-phosphate oxidase family protein [Chelativorans intermedius]|uniref:Pyridoxamine 5'-phosphate oxidase family protein n=1 Tax=Chelativorans intermedius TaxID=515947 RepID=A0ABV6DAP8_9HYPH|nr:pyridoxamine 5'-phosphate oxidase family protein [Chelativorans intermedius]MCT9000155.1 pyridoxamine 5'-phosphate oxidase family protein [Chelativorans intermedius]